MACLKGFEPLTFWFVAKHSIRLSYRHMTFSQGAYIVYRARGRLSMVLAAESTILHFCRKEGTEKGPRSPRGERGGKFHSSAGSSAARSAWTGASLRR